MSLPGEGQAGAQWFGLPPLHGVAEALAALHAVEREVSIVVFRGVAAGRGPGNSGGAVSFRAAGRVVGGGDARTVILLFCNR